MIFRHLAPCRFVVFFALFLSLVAAAQEKRENVFVRARIFNVPQKAVNELMSGQDSHADASGVMAKLSAMVAKNEAFVLANPSARGTLPGWGKSNGLVYMQFDLKVSPETPGAMTIEVQVTLGKDMGIHTKTSLKREQTIFLGSIDSPADGSGAPAGTNLVFLVVE